MRSAQEAGPRLTIVHDDTSTAKLWLTGAIVLLLASVVRHAVHPNHEAFVGGIAGGLVLAVAFVATFEKSLFTIDGASRMISWEKHRLLRHRQGVLPYDAVQGVVAETPLGDSGVPSRRIVLLTRQGDLPLATAYCPDHDDECLAIAARMRAHLGLAGRDALVDEIRPLVAAGRTLDAIRMLRQRRKLSLTEARRTIAEMQETRP